MVTRKAKKRTGPRSLAGALAVLRRFYLDESVPGADREAFWAVVSALRGPDRGVGDRSRYDVKACTTAVIRRTVLRHPAPSAPGLLVRRDSPDALIVRQGLMSSGDHFVNHARQAFYALGLKWDKVNR